MGRFLMLFESFLAPLDSQIKGQSDYLDPFLAPVEFIPWLASWTDMKIDEELPPENKRNLLKVSASLLRARGTRKALKEYLEIYTGGKVEIREHFSQNFQLGKDAKLGQDTALGTDNVPQTFTVKLNLPPLPGELDEDERSMQMLNYERKIRAIIEAEKPIHTGYKLLIQTGPRA
jgi:phage tail-like protein